MGRLTTHVLDIAQGKPAAGVAIELRTVETDGPGQLIATATTNADGRTESPLLQDEAFIAGGYQLIFRVGDYFAAQGVAVSNPPFLDVIPIWFQIADASAHHHVPLLVSPWAYSTYRGS
jgi:5-hydroxyisourate hydrolase